VKNHPIFSFLVLCSICFYGSEAKAQRASEQPLSAFYSPAMQEKMNRKSSLQPANRFQKRASEKQLADFTSKTMKSRLNKRSAGQSRPADTRRASEKPLQQFYSKAMKAKVNARTNGTPSRPHEPSR
jgi:hypothetical protein